MNTELEAAKALFASFGHDPDRIATTTDLHAVWRQIAWTCHPDRGGRPEAMSDLNVAYASLKADLEQRLTAASEKGSSAGKASARKGTPRAGPADASRPYTPPRPHQGDPSADDGSADAWVKGSQSGRFQGAAGPVRKKDYTDRNFIRKAIFERSGDHRAPYHVQGFDGSSYVGLVLMGSEDLVPEMVRAIAQLHRAETGAQPLAVLVRPLSEAGARRGCQIWLLGAYWTKVELEDVSGSVNDPEFIARLNKIVHSASAA
jgi:hypothetical protein